MKRAVSGLLLSMFLILTSPVSSRSITFSDFNERNQQPSLPQTGSLAGDINPRALDLAMRGYFNLKRQGLLKREGILTLIDFDKPSVTERLYIIDVNNGTVLQSALVAHGKGSGDIMATRFSNRPGSNSSSLGLYLTETTYSGRNGYSLVLKGLDQGVNDKAESRSIVIHGADYVSQDYIRRYGRLGRSQGCPAISFDDCQQLIDTIKDGTCLFIYHAGNAYASKPGVRHHRTAFRSGRHPRHA
ncbi:MAG: murein L,D-transpeptidase catalytic domain family protein [Chlorobiaceae bacterium]|nr:murein L,D-transpeptidase catalytic domain family protein [Chlorobiaceae bacterium]